MNKIDKRIDALVERGYSEEQIITLLTEQRVSAKSVYRTLFVDTEEPYRGIELLFKAISYLSKEKQNEVLSEIQAALPTAFERARTSIPKNAYSNRDR